MADVRITALAAASSLNDSDVLHGVQAADNKDRKFSLADLKTYVGGGGGGGTVSSVTAGAGLANSGTATDPIIDVGGGTGITVNANNIAVDRTTVNTWYAPFASPAFTGTPTAPTATAGTSTTQLATTAFVAAAVTAGTPAASETVQGIVELATAAETTTGTDNTRAVHPAGLKVELDKKANLASPALTGTPTAPTATAGTSTTQLATTAFVTAATPNSSETVRGLVELATAAETTTGTDTTLAVHPAGLKVELDKKANLASPTFTGTPAGPTATAGTSTTQLATTAFVAAAITAIPAASETVSGRVELATAAETTTGTDNTRAVHPKGLKVELDKKANLASPTFTGTPAAPTATAGTNTTQVATTAFVTAAITAIPAASETVRGRVELATAAETTTGTDNTRAVHPAGLRVELLKKLNLTGGALTGRVSSTERTITAGAFDMATGNFWTCGAIAIPNPTNAVAATSGLIRLTAAPTGWGGNFKHAGGAAPAPTAFPAIVPFFVQSATTILVGKPVEGMA